ncbi:MAG: LemA family protein [Slackia sp.]|nr:LemA family protein [Slackia sp.]
MDVLGIAVLFVAVIAAIVIVAAIVTYNNLVKLRSRVDNAWSQIDVQMQRRLDLIPNLVEAVKGYASHEARTLQGVTAARAAVAGAANIHDKMAADAALTGTLKGLLAISEAYPDLKASAGFQQLQSDLSATEDKIGYMRQSYNDTVMKYNTAIQAFPGVLFAGLFGFKERESFDASLGAEVTPVVQF